MIVDYSDQQRAGVVVSWRQLVQRLVRRGSPSLAMDVVG